MCCDVLRHVSAKNFAIVRYVSAETKKKCNGVRFPTQISFV